MKCLMLHHISLIRLEDLVGGVSIKHHLFHAKLFSSGNLFTQMEIMQKSWKYCYLASNFRLGTRMQH
jgi:hypothetical protein